MMPFEEMTTRPPQRPDRTFAARLRAFARMVLPGAAAALIVTGATAASAQSWQSRINDSGALMSAAAFAPDNTLAFTCTAPSPSGRPLIETGDHEAQRTDTPFTMIVTVGDGLLDPYTDDSDLARPLVTLDATTFGLPPMPWDEFFWNWNTTLSMSDQIFTTARSAGSLVLDPGRGTAFQFSADGLTASLVRAMSYCITGWQLAGRAVPPDLMPILQAAASLGAGPAPIAPPTTAPPPPVTSAWPGYAPIRSSRLPAGYSFAPLLPLPATAPPQGDAHLTALCQGVVFGPRPRAGRRSGWRRARRFRAELVGRRVSGRHDGPRLLRGRQLPYRRLHVVPRLWQPHRTSRCRGGRGSRRAGADRPAAVGNGLRL